MTLREFDAMSPDDRIRLQLAATDDDALAGHTRTLDGLLRELR